MKRLCVLTTLVLALSCGNEIDPELATFTRVHEPSPFPKLADAPPLPAWETAEERAARLQESLVWASHFNRAPTGTVSVPAEYTSLEGAIVNVPLYEDLTAFYGQMLSGIVGAGVTPSILVDSNSTATSVARYVLAPYGVSTSQVSFVSMTNDAFWTRDYGPWHIYLNGQRRIVDVYYYPNRRNDDAVPHRLGDLWDEDVYTAPFYGEGGNFMTDGLGTCWTSYGMVWNNNLSESQLRSIYRSYLGCEHLVFVPPIPDEGTTHIDMLSKILNQDTILVATSDRGLGASNEEIDALDEAAQVYQASPKAGGGSWNIVRIPMSFGWSQDYYGATRVYYAHTNSLIVNDTVLVPNYNLGTDSEALRIYREAMPGYRVKGVASREVIPMGGSVHCTTMQVPVAQHASCGDGVIAGQEQCEPRYLRGATCASLGLGSGTLRCSSQCRFDTSSCSGGGNATPPAAECGNGTVEQGETCDGNSRACSQLGDYSSGTATCNARCSGWDTSACAQGSPAPATGEIVTLSHADTIQAGQWHRFVPFEAAAGVFKVTVTMDADVDVYLKRGSEPSAQDYDCRPYLEGAATEVCETQGPGSFYISINGYARQASYQLQIEYVPQP